MTALNLIYLRGLMLGTRNSSDNGSLFGIVLKTVKDLVTIGCAPRPHPPVRATSARRTGHNRPPH